MNTAHFERLRNHKWMILGNTTWGMLARGDQQLDLADQLARGVSRRRPSRSLLPGQGDFAASYLVTVRITHLSIGGMVAGLYLLAAFASWRGAKKRKLRPWRKQWPENDRRIRQTMLPGG